GSDTQRPRISAAPEDRRRVARWKRLLEGVVQGAVEMLFPGFRPTDSAARMFARRRHADRDRGLGGFCKQPCGGFAGQPRLCLGAPMLSHNTPGRWQAGPGQWWSQVLFGAPSGFVEEPDPFFGFVDPDLDEAGGGDIAMLVTQLVSHAHIGGQLLVVL